jgi:hypothetical protein
MKPPQKPSAPKPRKQSDKPRPPANERLTQQTRKILGKHYASKYRVK